VRFVADRTQRAPYTLTVADFDRDVILDFLDQLERARGNQPQTRNARLTAIRSFFRHVAASDPAALGVAQRVLAIPTKRVTSTAPRHVAANELTALLAAPDRATAQGRRDHALLLFLARTGARVSEAIVRKSADGDRRKRCKPITENGRWRSPKTAMAIAGPTKRDALVVTATA
jgi:site-specific recombinase XerD